MTEMDDDMLLAHLVLMGYEGYGHTSGTVVTIVYNTDQIHCYIGTRGRESIWVTHGAIVGTPREISHLPIVPVRLIWEHGCKEWGWE